MFARGDVRGLPVGVARGHVVYVIDSKSPRQAAWLQNAFWKGIAHTRRFYFERLKTTYAPPMPE